MGVFNFLKCSQPVMKAETFAPLLPLFAPWEKGESSYRFIALSFFTTSSCIVSVTCV